MKLRVMRRGGAWFMFRLCSVYVPIEGGMRERAGVSEGGSGMGGSRIGGILL